VASAVDSIVSFDSKLPIPVNDLVMTYKSVMNMKSLRNECHRLILPSTIVRSLTVAQRMR